MPDNHNDNSIDNLSVNEINELFEDIIELSDDACRFAALGQTNNRCAKIGPITATNGSYTGFVC